MMTLQPGAPAMGRVRRIHMLGIGGSGMAGIARKEVMLINLGAADRGTDLIAGACVESTGASA